MADEATLISYRSSRAVYLFAGYQPKRAVKYFYPTKDEADDDFKNELQLLKRLIHGNIVFYLGTVEKEDSHKTIHGIVMEYCERGSLSKLIFDPCLKYTMYTVLTWIEHVFLALCYLHQRKLMHRCVTPENIFATRNYSLKLGGFGSCREIDEIGEDLKRDVFSAGVILWELIERRYAEFDKSENQRRRGKIRKPIVGNSTVCEIVINCSHPDIKKRPSSLKQVLQVVEVKKLYSSYVFEPKIIDSKIVDSTPVKPEGYDEDVLVGPAVDAPSKTNTEKEVEPELESTSEKAKHMPKNASRQSAANEPNEGWPSLSSDFYSTKSTENKITSPELLATVFFEKTDSDKCPVETSHLISPMMMMIDDDPYESTLTHSNNPPQNTTDSSVDLLPQNAGPSAARSRVERNETQGIVALDSRLDALDQNSDQRPDELSSTSQNNRSGFRPDLRCSVNTRETSHLISPMVIDDDPYESTLTHSNNPDKCPVGKSFSDILTSVQ